MRRFEYANYLKSIVHLDLVQYLKNFLKVTNLNDAKCLESVPYCAWVTLRCEAFAQSIRLLYLIIMQDVRY